jgi:hypothetical protein
MSVFTATTMFVVPIGLGMLVMSGTNPELDAAKIEKLRRDAGLDTKIMVRAAIRTCRGFLHLLERHVAP